MRIDEGCVRGAHWVCFWWRFYRTHSAASRAGSRYRWDRYKEAMQTRLRKNGGREFDILHQSRRSISPDGSEGSNKYSCPISNSQSVTSRYMSHPLIHARYATQAQRVVSRAKSRERLHAEIPNTLVTSGNLPLPQDHDSQLPCKSIIC